MAMLGQIVGATMPEMAEAAPLGVICGVDQPAPGHAPNHRHHHDCAVCPLCAAAAMHAALVSPSPVLIAPPTPAMASRGLPPPARAPPSWRFNSPFPRGPPAFA